MIKTGRRIISLKVFSGYIKTSGSRTVQQFLIFKCGLTHLNFSLGKLRTTFELQKGLVKTEKKHEDAFDDTWKNKKDEWLDYVKSDVLFMAFSYTRYSKTLELFTFFWHGRLFNSTRAGMEKF